MRFYRCNLYDCAQAPGIVVVIDVLRATTIDACDFAMQVRREDGLLVLERAA